MSRFFFQRFQQPETQPQKNWWFWVQKWVIFFLVLFFKGPQFKDKLPFSNLKCPFFCRILLNQSKKWLGDKKMRVTHHLLGIWPQKHSRSSMHQLKTHFGVNSPLFQLKCSVLFSGIMINWLKNLLREKKWLSPIKLWVFDP